MNVITEGYVKRIRKLEKFLGVKQPKGMDILDWMDKLNDMEMEWEDEHQQEFPLEYMI